MPVSQLRKENQKKYQPKPPQNQNPPATFAADICDVCRQRLPCSNKKLFPVEIDGQTKMACESCKNQPKKIESAIRIAIAARLEREKKQIEQKVQDVEFSALTATT